MVQGILLVTKVSRPNTSSTEIYVHDKSSLFLLSGFCMEE